MLQTLVGLCVFLAYGTTASVARLLGAGDRRGGPRPGHRRGLAGRRSSASLVTLVGVATTGPLVRLLGAGPEVAEPATTYLRIAFLGVTPLLVMLATTGILRGLQDTRTPLVVAVAGNALNIVLNLLLVYGVGPASTASASPARPSARCSPSWPARPRCCAVVVRGARREGASLRPDLPGIRAAAHASVALVIRTLTLRAALLLTTYAVVLGADAHPVTTRRCRVATHQLAFTIWSFLAFALDAIAIAAQAITGRYLGAGDRRGHPGGDAADGLVGRRQRRRHRASRSPRPARSSARCSPATRAVQDLLVPVLLVAAVGQPIAGRRVRPRRRADRRRRRHATWPGPASPCSRSTRPWCCWSAALGGGRGRGVGRLRGGVHGRPVRGARACGPAATRWLVTGTHVRR